MFKKHKKRKMKEREGPAFGGEAMKTALTGEVPIAAPGRRVKHARTTTKSYKKGVM